MAKFQYLEQGRVQSGDTTWVVVTKMVDAEGNSKGFFVNNFISSEDYTGPKKGCTIKESAVSEVLSYFQKESLEEALALQASRRE